MTDTCQTAFEFIDDKRHVVATTMYIQLIVVGLGVEIHVILLYLVSKVRRSQYKIKCRGPSTEVLSH